jgi:putative transposase
MAWGEIKVEEKRLLFVEDCQKNAFSMAELCRKYEISRKNGYKWLNRYINEGEDGLKNRSKAPFKQARATDPGVVRAILELKFKWPKWGPKKIRATLARNDPSILWPSNTTIGNLFSRHGLTVSRKLRRRLAIRTNPLVHCAQANDVWCMDYKGWWTTKDGQKCEPFTLIDACTRYLIRCNKLLANDTENTWAILQAAFHEYGLPVYLRSDNGPPFATTGAGRLSPLSVRIIKAGVIPEWIEPANPQQNGRLERMHLTLKQDSARPEELELIEQMAKLCEFQEYYNNIRPHEGIGQQRPCDIYQPSGRLYTGHLKSPEYSSDHKVGRVKSCGKMSLRGREVYIGRTLSGEPIGLKESEKGLEAYFGPIFLGLINENCELVIERSKPRRSTRKFSKKCEMVEIEEKEARNAFGSEKIAFE